MYYKGTNYLATATDDSNLFLACPFGSKIQLAGTVNYASTDASQALCTQDVSTWAQKVFNGMSNVALKIYNDITGTRYCSLTEGSNKITVPYQCQQAPGKKELLLTSFMLLLYCFKL